MAEGNTIEAHAQPRPHLNPLLLQAGPMSNTGSLSYHMQHLGSPMIQGAYTYALSSPVLGQEQFSMMGERISGGLGNFAPRWAKKTSPGAIPNDMPLDASCQSSLPYPRTCVAQPPAGSNAILNDSQYVPALPMERHSSCLRQRSPSPHFSWAQPNSLQPSIIPANITHSQRNTLRELPDEVTENINFQPGMAETAVGSMLGWIRRAQTIGDRDLPRLSTNLLAPPDRCYANRSPSSASTAGSSSSRHSRIRAAPGDLACFSCTATFANQGDLTHHLRSHQPYASRNHVCHKCEKRFQYRKDLIRHLPRHDPHRKKYYCPFSSCKYHRKGFGRQDHLDRHIITQHRVGTPTEPSDFPSL